MNKGIRVNEEGDASLEEFTIPGEEDIAEPGPPEQAVAATNSKKVLSLSVHHLNRLLSFLKQNVRFLYLLIAILYKGFLLLTTR